jgi:cation transport ATPase
MGLIALSSFLLFGFLLTRSAPADARWIVWILAASFIFPFCFLFLLVGRWLRRRFPPAALPASPAPRLLAAGTRVKIYAAITGATLLFVMDEARIVRTKHLFGATTRDVFFWEFVGLAVLIALGRFFEWRKRRSASNRRS